MIRGGVRSGRETAARCLSINGVSVVARPHTKNAAPRQGVQTIQILYGLGQIRLSKCKLGTHRKRERYGCEHLITQLDRQ